MAKCDICGRGAFFGNQVEIRSAIHIEDRIKSGMQTFRELL